MSKATLIGAIIFTFTVCVCGYLFKQNHIASSAIERPNYIEIEKYDGLSYHIIIVDGNSYIAYKNQNGWNLIQYNKLEKQ